MSAPQKIYRVYSFDPACNSVAANFVKADNDEAAIAAVEA